MGFVSYTFTPKPIQGITELPYHANFSEDTEPFEGGAKSSYTDIGAVLRVHNSTATARFKTAYTPKQQETVTVSFKAFHGWIGAAGNSTIALYNSENVPLVSYTYTQKDCSVTDVSFGNEQVENFTSFFAQSNYNNTKSANKFHDTDNQRFVGTDGYNPIITMTMTGGGDVSFNLKLSSRSIDRTFTAVLPEGIKKDIAYIKIVDTNLAEHADRCIGIDDLSVASQLYSYDYENTGGLTDWTSSTGGRYTPAIMEEANGNHYMGVNQSQRYNNGTTLVNNTINGAAVAGENFTLEFDMKIGQSSENNANFKIYDAAGGALLTIDNKDNNKWQATILGSTPFDLPLVGNYKTGGNGLDQLEWLHYKVLYTNGYVYFIVSSLDGTLAYSRGGYATTSAGGLQRLAFATGRYNANFAFDNLKVAAYANTHFTQSGKSETYKITSEGDLKQKEEGKTITLEYGTANQIQMTKTNGGSIGAYCMDNNLESSHTGFYTRAWGSGGTAAPNTGTFYKFTPKYNGNLRILGGVEDAQGGALNKVTLRTANGDQRETIDGSTFMDYTFTTIELQAGKDYYLFAETEGTGNYDSEKGKWATLYLAGFTFTQTNMNREIVVADLLYANGKKQSDGLDRIIPGFELEFTGGTAVETVENGTQLKFYSSGSGTMKISLRQNGHGAKITGLKFDVGNASGDARVKVNGGDAQAVTNSLSLTPAGEATIVCTAGDFRIKGIMVGYQGYIDESSSTPDDVNIATWLDEEKTTRPTFHFTTAHIMRIPGDGVTFQNNTLSFDTPSSFSSSLTYSSSNYNIATINTDGSNGLLLRSGEATITATFEETDYFLPNTTTYVVNNKLLNGESYSQSAEVNQVVRVTALADASTTLTIAGTNKGTMSVGTESSRETMSATETTVTLSNSTDTPITIERLQIFTKRLVAYLYYKGQEENYSQQVQFQNFTSEPITGFRVLDIGDPTDPVDVTAGFEMSGNFSLEHNKDNNGMLLSCNISNGSVTIKSGTLTDADFETETVDEETVRIMPVLKRTLTNLENGVADDYDASVVASATICVTPPEDEDTYKTWDFRTTIGGNGQLDSRWTWDMHNYYQTWLPSYLPILTNEGETLPGNEGILIQGDMRYHVGSNGMRMNLTQVNARMKFPVKKGMEVKIEIASSSADVTDIITNALDVKGASTRELYIEQAGANVITTAYYLAASDGCMELYAMDKVGNYLKSITLQVPRIHFDEEIVTELGGTGTARIIKNTPNNVEQGVDGATLVYEIEGNNNYSLSQNSNETPLPTPAMSSGAVATITDSNKDEVSITGTEGWVKVNVTNTNATGTQPKKGSYLLYVVDFKFDPDHNDSSSPTNDPSLNLDLATNGEVTFNRRPIGYDKVVSPIKYTMELVSDATHNPYGRITQSTASTPSGTTYTLTAYGPGTIKVHATTGRITTTCILTVIGHTFFDLAPAKRLDELDKEGESRIFLNQLPDYLDGGSGTYPTVTYTIAKSGTANCDAPTTAEIDGKHYTKLTNITGNGAIRVTATTTQTIDGVSRKLDISFVLTLAYPASSGKKWNFYKLNSMNIGKIENYNADDVTNIEKTINGSNSWTTTGTTWSRNHKKGDEQPRWAYDFSMKRDNAFIIEETEGLQIETGKGGFYVDNPLNDGSDANYYHIGLHNNASITIPHLKKDDYVSLNICRVIPNNGAILRAENVNDLAGTPVTHEFTITRSQTDYRENGELATDGEGHRIIPGMYTFRVAADGDVTFTLADEGYLDILGIEIYNNDYLQSSSYIKAKEGSGQGYDTSDDYSNGYIYTMTPVKLDNQEIPQAFTLKEEDDSFSYNGMSYTYCNQLWSTSVGPASYEVRNKSSTLSAAVGKVDWYSPGGAYYEKGQLDVGSGYGKITLRMNNYTAEGRYLIGYTPDYTLTVGVKPHQDYPHTWNFRNISGGTRAGQSNNVLNSISNDGNTWTHDASEGSYTLNTNNSGTDGSLYVPGAALVSTPRMLGVRGETPVEGKGFDELNGLGVAGSIKIFPVGAPTSAARSEGPHKAITTNTALTCVGETTITIPDLNANGKQDWIYIKASAEPTVSNATPITTGNDGPDNASSVFKFKVSSPGNCDATFSSGTTVEMIGVTHILKPLTQIGNAAWATESRRHSIDHTLTGYFTVNDVNAYTVKEKDYTDQKVTVKLEAVSENVAVPAKTGVVLKLDDNSNLDKAYTAGDGTYRVPLFYPAVTTAKATGLAFNELGNLMMPNLELRTLTGEYDSGVLDDNEDDIDDTGCKRTDSGVNYARFMLAKRYMTWKNENGNLTNTAFKDGNAAVFYRLHIYNDETEDKMDANKAYLLLPKSHVPKKALWDTSADARRRYVAIQGVSDMEEEYEEEMVHGNNNDGHTYNLRGQAVESDGTLPTGIYIRNGRKVVVK